MDPLWLDASKDEGPLEPICNNMGGVNDDPAIPAVGGWNNIVLDLTRFTGSVTQIRFRFASNEAVVGPGCYVDDVEMRGRPADSNPASPSDVRIAHARLWAPYPSPAVGLTTLRYAPSSAGRVSLSVYDLQGRLVRTLVHEAQDAGIHTATWDRRSDTGRPAASGAYLCVLHTDHGNDTRRLVLTD